MKTYNYKGKGLEILSLTHLFRGNDMVLDKEMVTELRHILNYNSGALGK